MKKVQKKTSILYVRVTPAVRKFIEKQAIHFFGTARKDSTFVNQLFEDLMQGKSVRLNGCD